MILNLSSTVVYRGMGGVPFTPHIMGHIDDQTRRKLQGKQHLV